MLGEPGAEPAEDEGAADLDLGLTKKKKKKKTKVRSRYWWAGRCVSIFNAIQASWAKCSLAS